MRLSVLPLLLLGSLAPAARQPEAPRPLVVLVHGRGQLGADSAAMRRLWKSDIDSALARSGYPTLRDDDVRLAWYADVMDPGVEGACGRAYRTEAALGDMARGVLASLVSLMPDSGREEDQAARSLLGDMLYVVDPKTRCAAETRFGDLLLSARTAGRPVVVVAYSLGAAVAYGHLSRGADSGMAVRLVTLGAPLGVPVAREMLLGGASLRVPAGVVKWVNIYDADDAFAGPLGLSTARVVDRRVTSTGASDPHHAGRYLRDVETGNAVAEALCDATAGSWASACDEVNAGGR